MPSNDLVETLVEALLYATRKLHVEGQLVDPDGFAWAEQEAAEDALEEWLATVPPTGWLARNVRGLLDAAEAARS